MSDLLPNDATYFLAEQNNEDKVLLNRERGDTLEAYPLIESIIEWFEIQATEAEKITNIDVESTVPVQAQVIAFNEVARLLREKKGDLTALVNVHVKNRKK